MDEYSISVSVYHILIFKATDIIFHIIRSSVRTLHILLRTKCELGLPILEIMCYIKDNRSDISIFM